jgi:hypothetical protein
MLDVINQRPESSHRNADEAGGLHAGFFGREYDVLVETQGHRIVLMVAKMKIGHDEAGIRPILPGGLEKSFLVEFLQKAPAPRQEYDNIIAGWSSRDEYLYRRGCRPGEVCAGWKKCANKQCKPFHPGKTEPKFHLSPIGMR